MARRGPDWLRWTCLVTALVAGCKSSVSDVMVTVGPSGGVVAHAGGFTVVVPPGALTQPIPLQIHMADGEAGNGFEAVGSKFTIGSPAPIDGLALPLVVHATFAGNDTALSLFAQPEADSGWVQLPTTVDAGTLVATSRTLTLGTFEVGRRTTHPDLAPRLPAELPIARVGTPLNVPANPPDTAAAITRLALSADVPGVFPQQGQGLTGIPSIQGHYAFRLFADAGGFRSESAFVLDVAQAFDEAPVASFADPGAVPSGEASVVVSLSGTGFQPNSAVLLGDGHWRVPARYLGPQRMVVVVPGSMLLKLPRNTAIRVQNGELLSPPLPFTVIGGAEGPAGPIIASTMPARIPAGSGAVPLVIFGTGFAADAQALVNGTTLDVEGRSATSLSVTLPATATAQAGSVSLQVVNPGTPAQTSPPFAVPVFADAPDAGTFEEPDAGTPPPPPDAGTPFDAGVPQNQDNPVPAIAAIQPPNAAQWSARSQHAISGSGFVQGSQVQVGGRWALTTYVSPFMLQVWVEADSKSYAGDLPLTVTNPVPGGGTSPPFALPIIAATTPPPVPSIVTPASVLQNSPDTMITVLGAYFDPAAVVVASSQALETHWDGPTQLRAVVPGFMLTAVRNIPMMVRGPGGTGGSIASGLEVKTALEPYLTNLGEGTPFVWPGSPDTRVHVFGGNFVPGTVAVWNEVALPTSFVGDHELWALAPAAMLEATGVPPFKVRNPASVGGLASATFLKFGANGVGPTVRDWFPKQVAVGSDELPLEITFAAGEEPRFGATATVDGTPATLVAAGGAAWRVTVPAGALSTRGVRTILVQNPDGSRATVLLGVRVAAQRPTITQITPNTAVAGQTDDQTFFVTGTHFAPETRAIWLGRRVPVAYVDPQHVQFTLHPTDLLMAGDVWVTLVVPELGAAGWPLVIQGSTPVPTVTNVRPNPLRTRAFDTPVQIVGTNVISGATTATAVSGTTQVNLGPCFGDASTCPVVIPASLMATGNFRVRLETWGLGGGSSNEFVVPFAPPPPALSVALPPQYALFRGLGPQLVSVAGTGFGETTFVNGGTWTGDASSPGIFRFTVPEADLVGASLAITLQNGGPTNAQATLPIVTRPRLDALSPSPLVRGGVVRVVATGSFPASSTGYLLRMGKWSFESVSATASQLAFDVPTQSLGGSDVVEAYVVVAGQPESNRLAQVIQ